MNRDHAGTATTLANPRRMISRGRFKAHPHARSEVRREPDEPGVVVIVGGARLRWTGYAEVPIPMAD
jgi:hypothetical protein